MKNRLSIALALAALFVAALGSTSVGQAASDAAKAGVNKARSSALAGPLRINADQKVRRGPRGLRGKRGLRGLRGLTGPIGPAGPAGPAGAPNPNADKLDGLDANGIVRVARGVGLAFPATTGALASCGAATETQVAAVTITAPAAGFVQVAGAFTARNLGAGGTVRAHLLSGGALSSFIYSTVGNVAGQATLASFSPTWVFPVAAAGAVTVQLEACQFATGTDAFGGQLSAVYSPFGSTGTATLGPTAAAKTQSSVNPSEG